MQLEIITSDPIHVVVRTSLAAYSIIYDETGDFIRFLGPGVSEEHSTLDFPDPTEHFAIAAYLVARLESAVYGS